VDRTAEQLERFVEQRPDLLEARVRDGRIVEGHGDLRPEHVCLLRDPVVIDCLEFNRELRTVDVADELGYLGMECARLGSAAVGNALFARVADSLADRVPPALKAFYCGCRALTRARIAAWHNVDAPGPDPSKWTRRAGDYLALAETYSRDCCGG
jgi:aminoglycoside phosphotransferase family enzyme